MKWVTRERARVDRIACPWLITRFIDRNPEFLFVPAKEVRAVAERWIAPGMANLTFQWVDTGPAEAAAVDLSGNQARLRR